METLLPGAQVRVPGPGGLACWSGSTLALLGPEEHSAPRSLVDELHLACPIGAAGRRRELEEERGATGIGGEPACWAAARASAQIRPDGNRERTMLFGLKRSQEQPVMAAARSSLTVEKLGLGLPGP